MQLPEHGANPHHVYAKLGIEVPGRVLDFSENVNPEGPPQTVRNMWKDLLAELGAYPDPEGEPFLSAVAEFHGISTSALFVGNGAAELLALVAERYRGKRALVVHPTFSEYEATLRAKNVEIVRVVASEITGFQLPLDEIKQAMASVAVVYLCTPNNPTGVMPKQEDLHEIIRCGAEMGCDVVLDEAFIDFVDESLSFITKIEQHPHVIVIRSMTKMYAIPGIRLGYVIAHPAVIAGIKALAPHWNVNGLAARIGAVCLQEEAFRQQAIRQSQREREKLASFLMANGCTVTNSVTNFLSFKLGEGLDAKQFYRDLLQRGIVVRHSENFRGMDGRWFRIGMKNEAAMAVLKQELTEWFRAQTHAQLTFICGGVRSGKSRYAEQLLVEQARQNGGRLVYIASGTATDSEMQSRIDKHRQDRANQSWVTLEQPTKLEDVLPHIQQGDYVLWDCLTTWLANELYAGWAEGMPCIGQSGCMEQKVRQLYDTLDALLMKVAHLVIVSNEVLDELPASEEETAIYCGWMGRIHQQLVAKADRAIEMDYGVVTEWKNERRR